MSGLLVAVEGIDGSGKTTQVNLLRRWLEERGERVFLTEWNSSDMVRRIIRRGKRKNLLTPTTFSILHATDFADRYERTIQPHLAAGYVVLCDRYAFTGRSRDVARGVDADWVENLYSFARKPDVTFYFRVTPKLALSRLLAARGGVKFYESGMDLGLADEPEASFLKFQQRVVDAYDRLAASEAFVVLEGQQPIGREQSKMRARLLPMLESDRKRGESKPATTVVTAVPRPRGRRPAHRDGR
ncbi:MAG TPA: dTMP kinase [Thermoplasmata archaeon]|nr:dTMP kinase [Thermoplasmata archaeon]